MLHHHHAPMHSFNLLQGQCHMLHHMITLHIHTLHLWLLRHALKIIEKGHIEELSFGSKFFEKDLNFIEVDAEEEEDMDEEDYE
jgi:hypothetical protein